MFELWLTGFIIGSVLGITLYLGYCWIVETTFDRGYWSGRASGWRAANEHYEKIRKLRSESVFDYDKN